MLEIFGRKPLVTLSAEPFITMVAIIVLQVIIGVEVMTTA